MKLNSLLLLICVVIFISAVLSLQAVSVSASASLFFTPPSLNPTLKLTSTQLKKLLLHFVARSTVLFSFDINIKENTLELNFTTSGNLGNSNQNSNHRLSAEELSKMTPEQIREHFKKNYASSANTAKESSSSSSSSCIVEICDARMRDGLFSYSKISPTNCPNQNTREKFIPQLETLLETFKRYQPLLKGVSVDFTFENFAEFSLTLTENAESGKAAWFVWTFLTQEIIVPAQNSNDGKNHLLSRKSPIYTFPHQNQDDAAEESLMEAFDLFKTNFIHNKLFNTETAGKMSVSNDLQNEIQQQTFVKLSPDHQLHSLMEMMHDFFRQPSFHWFVRVATSWFNLFCDVASCGNYINMAKVTAAGHPVVDDILLKRFPCRDQLSDFIRDTISSNKAIPFLYFLMKHPEQVFVEFSEGRGGKTINQQRREEILNFFSPVLKCFSKSEYMNQRYAEDGKVMKLLRQQILQLAKSGTLNHKVIRNLAVGKRHFALLMKDIFVHESNEQIRQEVTKLVSGILFGFRFLEHVEYSGVEDDIKSAIFISGFQIDTGFHPVVLKDLLGLNNNEQQDSTSSSQQNNDPRNSNEDFVSITKQDSSSCFADKTTGELNLKGTADKCHVINIGNFFPKFLKKALLNQNKNKNKEQLESDEKEEEQDKIDIVSLEKDFQSHVDVTKYSPLTLNETWKVQYTDTTYKATIRMPLPDSLHEAGYDCQLLHKKCWKCGVVIKKKENDENKNQKKKMYLEITNGVMIREYYPNQETNRCLDCARAAELANEGGEVPWKCTLVCHKKSTQSNGNSDL